LVLEDFKSFPAGRSALNGRCTENKPASLLVVSLGKTLNGKICHLPSTFEWLDW